MRSLFRRYLEARSVICLKQSLDVEDLRRRHAPARHCEPVWRGPRNYAARPAMLYRQREAGGPYGLGADRAEAGGDRSGGRRGLFAADGRRRGRHARAAQRPSQGADRPQDRRARRSHHQDHRGWHAGRVRLGRGRSALCSRNPARHVGTKRRHSPGEADRFPGRNQCRRRDRGRRRHLWRRGQCRGAAGGFGGTRRHSGGGGGPRPGARQAELQLRRSRRPQRQEYSATRPRLSSEIERRRASSFGETGG